jgi:hypothetical protein
MGFLDFLERILGWGKRYYCRKCRLQFFERRDPQKADGAAAGMR